MYLSRRASWFLLAFAAWSWFIWVTLIKNIAADPRSWGPGHHPTGFLGVHVVLAVISITFGTAIGRLGWRALRNGAPTPEPGPAGDARAGAPIPAPADAESVSPQVKYGENRPGNDVVERSPDRVIYPKTRAQ